MHKVLLIIVVSVVGRASSARQTLRLSYRLDEELRPGTFVGNVMTDARLAQVYGPSVDVSQLRFGFLRQGGAGTPFSVDERTGVIIVSGRLDREALCADANSLGTSMPDQRATWHRGAEMAGRRGVSMLDLQDDGQRGKATVVDGGTSEVVQKVTGHTGASVLNQRGQTMTVDRSSSMSDQEAGGGGLSMCLLRMDVAVQPMMFFRIVRVLVYVVDINDSPPRFPDEVITLNVSESIAVGTRLPLPAATDADSGGRFTVTGYQLHNNGDSEAFELEVTASGDGRDGDDATTLSLQLVVASKLDREQQDIYRLTVYAFDGSGSGGESNRGSVDVIVNVLDVNDNKPRFEGEGRYEVTISEDIRPLTTILQVHATDDDHGVNAQVVYALSSMSAMEYSDLFAVNSSTGELYVLTDVDYERRSVYHITLVASDGGLSPADAGGQTATARITVHVTDVNDNRPRIVVDALSPVPGHATTPEATVAGSFVARVVATDADAGSNGRVSCQLGGNDSSVFRLDPAASSLQDGMGGGETEYQVITASVLDRETKDQYHLIITCRDAAAADDDDGSLTSSVTLLVDVADVNDHEPTFERSNYRAEMFENNYVGAAVLTVSATDADSGQNAEIVYSLEYPWTGVDGFNINPTTGVITAARVFNRELVVDPLRFLAVASDRGQPLSFSATATVTVSIVDVNDEAPVFVQSAAHNISGSGSAGEFGYVFEVSENMPSGTLVGRVTARDADHGSNAVISYTLSSPGHEDDDEDDETAAAAFQVDSVTGELRTRRVLDHEQLAAVRLTVTATDGGGSPLSESVHVLVRVLDDNDNWPQFTLDDDARTLDSDGAVLVALSPHTRPGSVVTSLRATDADADDVNSHVTYHIVPAPGCSDVTAVGYDVMSDESNDVITAAVDDVSVPPIQLWRRGCDLFAVDAETGELTLRATGLRNLEDGSSVNVTVSATDSGVPPLSSTVLVHVVINSSVPVLPTVPTHRHRQYASERWLEMLLDDFLFIVVAAVIFVIVACCLSVVVVLLAVRRSKARQRRFKGGYNCRAEEQKALDASAAAAAAVPPCDERPQSVIVYGSCQQPRRAVPCHDWDSPRSERSARTCATSNSLKRT